MKKDKSLVFLWWWWSRSSSFSDCNTWQLLSETMLLMDIQNGNFCLSLHHGQTAHTDFHCGRV